MEIHLARNTDTLKNTMQTKERKMNSANVLLVCIAIFSIGSRQSSAIPLNCTVTSHQEIYVEVQTNGTVTCEISRRASKIIIEVVQCINNLTDCILDPGILIEKHDAHRTSTVTILSIRNHSEDLLVSCFDPYIKAPSTHLALPYDCLLLNHTYSDGVTETTNVEGQSNNYKAGILIGSVTGVVILAVICVVLWLNRRYIPLFEESKLAKFRQPRKQNEMQSQSGNYCGNGNPSTELKPLVPLSGQKEGQVDSVHVVVNDPTGTNGMKDFLILHAEDDAVLAREVKDKIDGVCGVNIRPLVDVFADVGFNHGQLSCLDQMMNEYRCVIFVITPNFKLDKIHLYQGETTLVMDLMDLRHDQQHRFVPLLCNIKRKDLKVGWLSTLIPLYYTDSGMQQVKRLIENIRKLEL
ncbi:uncharacterized protein LOC127867269 isoform X3 [Dreissena polymorpha]|uniref:uncharacterized protein LOC127867269 isoform X3 n=1 Tax=Dreissena polymorpha TaxID=45954 RepID=UPI002264A17E|nr:uncharacterized protein LOC127867269 isoform X3 [Dreissena polymorpha]